MTAYIAGHESSVLVNAWWSQTMAGHWRRDSEIHVKIRVGAFIWEFVVFSLQYLFNFHTLF